MLIEIRFYRPLDLLRRAPHSIHGGVVGSLVFIILWPGGFNPVSMVDVRRLVLGMLHANLKG